MAGNGNGETSSARVVSVKMVAEPVEGGCGSRRPVAEPVEATDIFRGSSASPRYEVVIVLGLSVSPEARLMSGYRG